MGRSYEGNGTLAMEMDDATKRVHEVLYAMPEVDVLGVWQGLVKGSVRTSWTSWGENITVTLTQGHQGTHVRIRSECSFPLQLLDWGRNKQNVGRIGQLLEARGPAT